MASLRFWLRNRKICTKASWDSFKFTMFLFSDGYTEIIYKPRFWIQWSLILGSTSLLSLFKLSLWNDCNLSNISGFLASYTADLRRWSCVRLCVFVLWGRDCIKKKRLMPDTRFNFITCVSSKLFLIFPKQVAFH